MFVGWFVCLDTFHSRGISEIALALTDKFYILTCFHVLYGTFQTKISYILLCMIVIQTSYLWQFFTLSFACTTIFLYHVWTVVFLLFVNSRWWQAFIPGRESRGRTEWSTSVEWWLVQSSASHQGSVSEVTGSLQKTADWWAAKKIFYNSG